MSRQTTRETTVLGHVIPAGTNCVLLTSAAMWIDESDGADKTDPHIDLRSDSSRKHGRKFGRFGRDVHQFDPSRWLRDDGTFDANAGPGLPFSAGVRFACMLTALTSQPRGCYGKALAMLELKLFVAMLSLSFFLDSIPQELDGDGSREVRAYERPAHLADCDQLADQCLHPPAQVGDSAQGAYRRMRSG